MGYNLHIERQRDGKRASIGLSQWLEAVAATDGVRAAAAAAKAIDPLSGARITVAGQPGDAEVYFGDDDAWHVVFLWTGDSAMFSVAGDFEHSDGPVRQAARRLAEQLEAVVVGDEGERY